MGNNDIDAAKLADPRLNDLTWEFSLAEARARSEKRAWLVAKGSFILAFLAILAFVLSMPFRQVVTRIVEIDKLTGESSVISDLPAYVSTRNDINDKFWVKQFVIAHERYVSKILQKDFDTVKVTSSEPVYTKFRNQFLGSNALQTKFEDRIEVVPTILSITLSSPNIATVRFENKLSNVKNAAEQAVTSRFIATLSYHYAPNVYAKEKDLIENPLGFIVDSYQVDPEVVATTDTPATIPPLSAPTVPSGSVPTAVPPTASTIPTLPQLTDTQGIKPIVPAIGGAK